MRYRLNPHRDNQPWGFVSDKHRFIYVPIPKNANTSMRQWFQKVEGLNLNREQLQSTELYPQTHDLNSKVYDQYYKFSIVRNPWDRIVSCYKNKISTEKITNKWFKDGVYRGFEPFGLFYCGMSFDAFVDAVCRIPDYQADTHFKSQASFIFNASGKIAVDDCYRFESVEQAVKDVCAKCNVELNQLDHLQRTQHDAYTAYYTKKTKNMIEKRYRTDIKMSGYSF